MLAFIYFYLLHQYKNSFYINRIETIFFTNSHNKKCICNKKEINAMPKNVPVKNRNGLLLNHFVFNCNTPSITKGITKTIHQPQLAYQCKKINNKHSNIMPNSSPVHLAQMGNCFPFQKNERAGKL